MASKKAGEKKLSELEAQALELLKKYGEKPLMVKEKTVQAVQELDQAIEDLKKPVVEEKSRESGEKEKAAEKKKDLAVKLQRKKDEIIASNKRITTVFDTLLRIVTEKKEISLKALSGMVGMPEREVEEDARLLEETGLVEVVYPPFGEIKLKKKEVKEF